MSNYENYFQDFPSRCYGLVDTLYSQAKVEGREVTFMLAIAASAFTVPFERLGRQSTVTVANDGAENPEAKKLFDKTIGGMFFVFYENGKDKTWRIIKDTSIDDKQARVNARQYWADKAGEQKLLNNISVSQICSCIRNALAHGNIFTIPKDGSRQSEIETLVFISEQREPIRYKREDNDDLLIINVPIGRYKVILVSPDDFKEFLERWVKFLKSLPVGD